MKLDEFQKKAVEDINEATLLIAPPGSGKTLVLIEKIKYLINISGYKGEDLCIFTFSRAASENIKERVKAQNIIGPFFGTLHSLAYKILLKRKKRKIITPDEGFALVRPVIREYGINHLEPRCIPDIFNSKGDRKSSIPGNVLKEMEKVYLEGKKTMGALDFEDLMKDFLKYLKTEEGKEELSKFKFILVDEFQDLNPIQLDILVELSANAKIFCVGDEDQCIYSFRGSSTDSMVNFDKYFLNGHKLYLKYNFRSAKSIIDYANNVIKENKLRNPKIIVNFREEKGEIRMLPMKNQGMIAEYIAEDILNSPTNMTKALLFRTNREIELYVRYFMKKGIEFSILDKMYNPWEYWLFNDIATYFKAPWNRDEFIRTVKLSGIRGVSSSLEEVKELTFFTPETMSSLWKFKLQGAKLMDFYKKLSNIRSKKPIHAIEYIFYTLGYLEYIRVSKNARLSLTEVLDEIKELKEMVLPFDTCEEFLHYYNNYKRIIEEGFIKIKNVVLSTLHSVKGMEFDRVYIPHMVEGMIPHRGSINDPEGERRLFYVGITRARNSLYIFHSEELYGKKSEVSSFIK